MDRCDMHFDGVKVADYTSHMEYTSRAQTVEIITLTLATGAVHVLKKHTRPTGPYPGD